jgi:hypothetical protein
MKHKPCRRQKLDEEISSFLLRIDLRESSQVGAGAFPLDDGEIPKRPQFFSITNEKRAYRLQCG